MLADPVQSFIPVLTGDNIGMSVAVDVRDGGGLVGPRIDHVLREMDFGGT